MLLLQITHSQSTRYCWITPQALLDHTPSTGSRPQALAPQLLLDHAPRHCITPQPLLDHAPNLYWTTPPGTTGPSPQALLDHTPKHCWITPQALPDHAPNTTGPCSKHRTTPPSTAGPRPKHWTTPRRAAEAGVLAQKESSRSTSCCRCTAPGSPCCTAGCWARSSRPGPRTVRPCSTPGTPGTSLATGRSLSLIHISEPTRRA